MVKQLGLLVYSAMFFVGGWQQALRAQLARSTIGLPVTDTLRSGQRVGGSRSRPLRCRGRGDAREIRSWRSTARARAVDNVRPSREGIARPRFPEHIQVREYRVGQDEQAWTAAFNDAFADHFGGWMGMPLAVWKRYVLDPTFKPEISLVAWDGEQIARFGHFRIDDELNALRQHKQGVMRYIGVRPAWRRQGLARALTRAGLIAVRRAGMDSVISGVDGTNVTGAHLLYLEEGFEVSGRDVLYRHLVP